MRTNLLSRSSLIDGYGTLRHSTAARWRQAAAMRHFFSDRGTATAEYAIATLAACGFAGVLLALLRSSEVKNLLSGLIKRALSVG